MQQQDAPARSPDWVSKTDMTRYFRCPYAFWLLDRGDITVEETVDAFHAQLLLGGIAFQKNVEATAVPITVPLGGLPTLFSEEHTLFGTPLFENPKLKIFGRPDGVDTDSGALIPIEVKSHKNVERIDELELAFYWLLLEPYRTRRVRDRRGVLFLRRNGSPERVEVLIPPHRFDEVKALLKDVRTARKHGVRPRICGCAVCSGLKRDEVHQAAQAAKDLTLIFGIGSTFAEVLEKMRLTTWDKLLDCDAELVVERMRAYRYYVSLKVVEQWKRHAESWHRQTPVYFGGPHEFGDSFIALDLEYNVGELIWLIGVAVVDGSDSQHFTRWADDAQEEAANLVWLSDFLDSHPDLPVVTWSGRSADIPELKKASVRLSLQGSLEHLFKRHLDLYHYSLSRLRLPIPGLGLKEVAAYFGIPRVSGIQGGMEAVMRYQEYRAAPGKRKATLRVELTEYNRDDVEALVGVAQQIRALAPAPGQLVARVLSPVAERQQSPKERVAERQQSPKERSDNLYLRYSKYFRDGK